MHIFEEKKPGFDVEANGLKNELTSLLGIKDLTGLRLLNRYDVEGIDEALFNQCVSTVFSEPPVDNTYAELPAAEGVSFAVEYLPGQFDQRAASAAECIQLISQGERPLVRSARVYLLEGALTPEQVAEIKKDNGDTTVDANEFYANSSAPVGTYPKYVGLIDYVEKASDDNDTVVLYQDLTAQTYVVSVKGSTLQVDTTISTGSRGFAVSPSAKTVLIQDSVTSSGKVTLMDDIYEYTGGSAGLERAVRNLNDNAKFKGYIGAVIENGVATSVVIYDKTETDINTGIDGSDIDGVTVTLNDPSAGKVSVSYTGTKPTDDQAISAIVSEMNKQGYTVTNTKYDNSVPAYVLSTTRKVGGMEVAQDFTWDGTKTQMITIKVDGTNKLVANGTTFASLFTSPSATEFASLNGNMKATNDSTALSAGDEINTTLHVQVTVTPAVTATGATTGFASGATATATADSTMTGYVQKGVAGSYKVVIEIGGSAATDAQVNLTEDGGRTLDVTTIAASTTVGTKIPVTVTLSASDTNSTVTLAFTVAD